ncbi:hypothetical protein BGZ76_010865 [Entomortierella beljakovae]|nr:hypothetical protein BGZ76_010865 [Entomortierella beljakovae]
MSGAELLVLQQNIKQYIITSQSRPLTAHEREEFEKIKEKLLPSLLRYSQSAMEGSSSNASSSDIKAKNPQPQLTGKLATLSSDQPEIYPTSQSSGRATTLRTSIKTKANTKSKHVSIVEPSNIVLQPMGLTRSTSTASITANTGKGGENKKRPRMQIYQDPEDTTQKRRRRKTTKGGDDSDKENRNPLDPLSPRLGNKVLRDNTNIINKTNNSNNNNKKSVNLSDPKSKIDNQTSVTSKKAAALAPNTAAKTLKSAPGAQQQQQQQQQTLVPSTRQGTIASTTVRAPPKTGRQTKRDRVEIHEDTVTPNIGNSYSANNQHVTIKYESSIITRGTEPEVQIILLDDGENEFVNLTEDSPIEKSRKEPIDGSVNEPPVESKPSGPSKSTKSQNDVLPSVDDDSAASFEPYAKRGAEPSLVVRRKAVEPSEVQGSEDSEESTGSQEMTFPMPGFLGGDLLEVEEDEATSPMPDFLGSNLPEDQQDEATFPMPGFLQDNLLEAQNDELNLDMEGRVPKETIFLDMDMEARESSNITDGVWCISDIKPGANTTICGNQDRWIAFESDSDIQFWGIDGPLNLPESKWLLHIQLSKLTKDPTQVTFAPDDTFAIVLSRTERSFYKVPLNQNDSTEQLKSSIAKVSWEGPISSFNCNCFIIENPNDPEISHQLVFGDSSPGVVCMVPIPSGVEDGHSPAQEKNVSSKALCYMDTNDLASSIVKVENTSSFILASYGNTAVLWDLTDCSKPVSVSDTSFISSSLQSPAAHTIIPVIMSATVPAKFFEEYEDALQSKTLLPSEWPILIVMMISESEVDDSAKVESDRCALYVMKGDKMELVHNYHGTQGIDSLFLWDILKPEAFVRFSLSDSPSQTVIHSQKQFVKKESPNPDTTLIDRSVELQRESEDSTDAISCASTLSPPPAVLSSSPDLPFNNVTEALEPCIFDRLPGPAIPIESQQQQHRKPTEWIDLTSVSWIGAKRVQFSVQKEQRWVVVEQQDTTKRNLSVVHIMDLTTILDSIEYN